MCSSRFIQKISIHSIGMQVLWPWKCLFMQHIAYQGLSSITALRVPFLPSSFPVSLPMAISSLPTCDIFIGQECGSLRLVSCSDGTPVRTQKTRMPPLWATSLVLEKEREEDRDIIMYIQVRVTVKWQCTRPLQWTVHDIVHTLWYVDVSRYACTCTCKVTHL